MSFHLFDASAAWGPGMHLAAFQSAMDPRSLEPPMLAWGVDEVCVFVRQTLGRLTLDPACCAVILVGDFDPAMLVACSPCGELYNHLVRAHRAHMAPSKLP